MKKTIVAMVLLSLTACASSTSKRETYDLINAELAAATPARVEAAKPDAIADALLPPLTIAMPEASRPQEERFSLAFSHVPARQLFMGLVMGTPYSMLVHPEVKETISANLKDVTLFEALDAIRELYGYDYTVEGSRIVIKPLTMQTKVFQVNYLTGNRKGTSDTHVNSGSINRASPATTTPGSTTSPTNTTQLLESSSVSTSSDTDFWAELKSALEAIVGSDKAGRSIVVSPQSGVVVIRAMPEELRNVAAYLKAAQISLGRQVILEAKIMEVQLNDGHQTGINWAAFRTGDHRVSGGMLAPGAVLQTSGPLAAGATSIDATARTFGGFQVTATPGADLISAANAAGNLFSVAFQSSNFAAMISFMESQGTVHMLSSPRIATLNNQKAILKVGTDEFFVTNVSTTTTTGTATTTTPSVTLQPFFSGVVLDVTPQIDELGNIILHIHPSVSQVTTANKSIDVGVGGSINLPLAFSSTSETDSIVRARDGNIVVIGGLMRQSSLSDRAQMPGLGNIPLLGALFRNTSQANQKRELVILLKPTVIQSNDSWTEDLLESQRRMQLLDPQHGSRRK